MSSATDKRTTAEIFNRKIESLLKVQKNKWSISNNILTIFNDDRVSTLYSFNLKDASGTVASDNVFSREPI